MKKEDELRQIAPEKLCEQKLFVLCRRNEREVLEEATRVVENWVAEFPDWDIKYKDHGDSVSPRSSSNKALSPIFGFSTCSGGRAEE